MKALKIKTSTFDWGRRTYLMGILNITPDSFSGDGVMAAGGDWIGRAVAEGRRQLAEGADLLDIGGESTRPGAAGLSLKEELSRVIPVIEQLAGESAVPISIDTCKAEVARQALAAGASLINDVWGFKRDAEMPSVAAESGAAVILMHNRSRPENASQQAGLGARYVGLHYGDLLADIRRELQESVEIALKAGVAPEKIIIDPGIGFGKTVEHNLELVYRLRELTEAGYPILAGPSRKSFVGYTLNLPPHERLEGTAAAVTLCIERGADIVRVHDVAAMQRVARLADAIVRRAPQAPADSAPVAAALRALLALHSHERIIVVGTTCTGKSTMLSCITGARDQDREVFPKLSKAEADYVCQEPWTPQIGQTMTQLVRERVKSRAGQPVFGTVVIDCDFIIELVISDELLKERCLARRVNFSDAKNMQAQIHAEVAASGKSYTQFSVG